jgi:hypothetical protein
VLRIAKSTVMWLVNTTSLELEEFFASDVPPYAILSHMWETEEVSFQDMHGNQSIREAASRKQGFIKVLKSTAQAAADGHDYVWIDTCCIDKKSSAELSESINSMFRWYKRAVVCYAFLADVPPPPVYPNTTAQWEVQFAHSRWFTRGWTLQELIAPSDVEFYSKDWTRLGSKIELLKAVHLITGIAKSALASHKDMDEFSVAQRMSWASKRNTTRMEDEAYCIMGIFDVNMPLLYGEGERAFLRLQEHILQKSDDHSLFAWTRQSALQNLEWRSLFAASPAEFSGAGGIVEHKPFRTEPYSITNQGLRISLPFVEHSDSMVIVFLNCYDRNATQRAAPVGIYLENLSRYVLPGIQEETYTRFTGKGNCIATEEMKLGAKFRTFIIPGRPIAWCEKWATVRDHVDHQCVNTY